MEPTIVKQSQSMHEVATLLHRPPTGPIPYSSTSNEFARAAEYKARANGSMYLFLDAKRNAEYESPRMPRRRPASATPRDQPQGNRLIDGSVPGAAVDTPRGPRVLGAAGQENARRSRQSDVATLLNTSAAAALARPPTPKPRVLHDEGEANAARHIVGTMKAIMDMEGNRAQGYLDPKMMSKNITKESRENQAKHTGSHMAWVMKPPTHPPTRAPLVGGGEAPGEQQHQRSRSEEDLAPRRNRRPDTAGKVILGQLPGNPVPEARVKYAGKEIYERHRGTLTSLMAEYGRSRPELDRPKMQRVADRQGGAQVRRLMQDPGRESAQARVKPVYRVRSADARRYARNSAGSSMTAYFDDSKPYKTYKKH